MSNINPLTPDTTFTNQFSFTVEELGLVINIDLATPKFLALLFIEDVLTWDAMIQLADAAATADHYIYSVHFTASGTTHDRLAIFTNTDAATTAIKHLIAGCTADKQSGFKKWFPFARTIKGTETQLFHKRSHRIDDSNVEAIQY